ncbi:MAG: DNA polymerase III subunit gamma/tau [Bacteroidetes bacterium]|nr:DNA polymerase III subunit gamma/tau [Bacteroidota bacterium]
MESFVVSARKYRPATFDTVVGQKSITNTLKNAIKNKHLAQSFLFCGPRGVGKTTCARIMAKTINCENISENIEACNVCPSCESFNKSASFNVHELDAASNNSVDDIRALVDQVRIPPQMGKYKIYIIDEVHMLSTQAFNAFLKTLEEPPAYAKFILATTEKHKIIPTILSRCQIYDFSRITVEDIAKHLEFVAKSENVIADPEALHVIAQKADGALRDALSIFDQIVSFTGSNITYEAVIENLNVLDYDYYFKMTDHILNNNTSEVLLLIDDIFTKGFEGSHFILGFGEHLRNILVCKNPSTVKLLEVSDSIKQKYLQQCASCSERFLLKALTIINQSDLDYRTATNKRLLLEIALLRMTNLVEEPSSEKKKPVEPVKPPQQIKQEPVVPKEIKESPNIQTVTEKPVKVEEKPALVEEKPALVEEQSAMVEEPKPNPKPITRSFGISIKDDEDSKEEKKKSDDEDLITDEDFPSDDFTIEFFNEIWGKLANIYKEKQTLFLALTKNPPIIKNNIIEVLIDNQIQELEINEKKIELLSYLRKQLNNYSVTLITKIIETNKVAAKKAYLPEEKISIMIEKKPEVKRLMDDLDLEISH